MIFASCGNRVAFKNDKISVTNKEMYSKFSNREKEYYNILRGNEWALACYAKKGRRKIYSVDTSQYKFRFFNDSTVLISLSGDTNKLIDVKLFDIFYGFIEATAFDSGFVFKDTNSRFNSFSETTFVFFENDILHHVFSQHINQDFLILSIHVYNRKSKYSPRRYRLCFQKSG